ncbi:MAG: 50S ribosomal protein L22 [Halobacteria archaeon]|nr:50S ribosomal protein L22 [Halobacteria archaeon]
MGISYSVDVDEEISAKAIGRERKVSLKNSVELAKHIKGMSVEEARETLEAVRDGEKAVPFKSHNSGVGHRKNLEGWDAGRFPEKASKELLKVLENASSNAEYKGLDPDDMKIHHVAAHKVDEVEGMKPRAFGRATQWNSPIIDIEMILIEEEGEE